MISRRRLNKKIQNSTNYNLNYKLKKSKIKYTWNKQNYLQMKGEKSMKNVTFRILSWNKLKQIIQKLKPQENN